MFHFATWPRPNEFSLPGNRRGNALAFAFDLPEEGGELVVIILRPLFVRMVMALGALHPYAEKNLADERARIRGFALVAKNRGGPILMRAPFGRKQLADKLVVRFVAPKAVAQPKIEQINGLHSNSRRIWANK